MVFVQPEQCTKEQFRMIFQYDEQTLSDSINEEDLAVAYYNQFFKQWVQMVTTVDTKAHSVQNV